MTTIYNFSDISMPLLQQIFDPSNTVISDEKLLKNLDLEPFPENEDIEFYQDYLAYLEDLEQKTENKRKRIFNKMKKIRPDTEKIPQAIENKKYMEYRSYFIKLTIKCGVIRNHIQKINIINHGHVMERMFKKD